jgi:ribosomal protein L24E
LDGDDKTLCGAAPLVGGVATCVVTHIFPPGPQSVGAFYPGDSDYAAGYADPVAAFRVAKAATKTTLKSSVNPAHATDEVNLRATVSSISPGTGIPDGGEFTFAVNGRPIPGCVGINSYFSGFFDGSYTCKVQEAKTIAGTIVVTYGQDLDYASSTSVAIHEDVSKTPTSIGAGTGPQPVVAGQPVSFVASVTAPGGVHVDGNVTFHSGTTELCHAFISNGTTSCSSRLAPIGNDSIVASFHDRTGTFGDSSSSFTLDVKPPDSPVVAVVATALGRGYWIVRADGAVSSLGDARFFGSVLGDLLNEPIVGMAATPDDRGYWLVAADGGIFSFGDAGFYGSTGAIRLNKPIVAIASTPSGKGYFFVASDGGVFAFGDAKFRGSMGAHPLNRPVVGMAEDRATGGYWLVAADGGIFSFGAPFFGSTGALHLNSPIVGMEASTNGSGYRFVASDGGVFAFDLPYSGSLGGAPLQQPVVGIAAAGQFGYWLVVGNGAVFTFDVPSFGSAD